MKYAGSGITAPVGFKANGVWCGIKKNKNTLDLALIYSMVPCNCAGVFTNNRIKAAPVLVTKDRIKNGRAQAILVNSGNANCLSGKNSISDVNQTTYAVAKFLGINKKDVLSASTGIIGKKLPVDKIKNATPLLTRGLSKTGAHKAAAAIMTTDTFAKEEEVKFRIKSSTVTIGGMAKGSGMISPNLATMLCFLTTDAAIEKTALKKALKETADNSFNCITVDGETSTNDTVLILANGLAGNPVIKIGDKNYKLFYKALSSVCEKLAKKIVSDGEGATKFVEVTIKNAKSFAQAKTAAKRIANSPLVKTAIAGSDANWGRIAASVGASGAEFKPDKLDIYLGGIKALSNGGRTAASHNKLKKIFDKKYIRIDINLHNGKANSTVWTCDLTEDYIKINTRYST